MPRGGGGFRGGGGGMRGGGGFRGGGFRGSSGGFRSSSRIRSSGRPFGRTGARRTTSSSRSSSRSSGPYRHHHRPHRRYYGGYYRPWYRRWWGWNRWWGPYYRPWYYSPVYMGGGLVFAIVLALIFIPLLGFAIAYPFSNVDADGNINYRATETLYFNEYWYEYEYIKAGNTISYDIQSDYDVSFVIYNDDFDMLPTTTMDGQTDGFSADIAYDYFEYVSLFLKPGSSIEFSFTADGPIEFFVADGDNAIEWNNYGNPNFIYHRQSTTGESAIINIDYASDYYLLWYNPSGSSVEVTVDPIDYHATGVYDLDNLPTGYAEEGITDTEGTFNAPTNGNWYFFVYFDPFNSPEEETTITFDVTYSTDTTSTDQWASVRPILIFVGVIAVIILLVTFINRRGQKNQQAQPATTTAAVAATTSGSTTTTTTTTPTAKTCVRCGGTIKDGSVFCHNCGAKIEGRQTTTPPLITPSTSTKCANCNQLLSKNAKFCKACGAKVASSDLPKDVKVRFDPSKRTNFFCQLCNEQKSSMDPAYQCDQCSRYVCGSCYASMMSTGVTVCPYCKGELIKTQ